MVHGCMVYTVHAEMAAVSHGTSHVCDNQKVIKSTTSGDYIFKTHYKKRQSFRITRDKNTTCLLELRIALYESMSMSAAILCQTVWISDIINKAGMCGESIKYIAIQLFSVLPC